MIREDTSLHEWVKGLSAAITVCDRQGVIIEMNESSAQNFAKQGGSSLCGSSLLECHHEPSRSQLEDMLAHPRPNTYITEKNGVRRLVHQEPWYDNGQFGGYVEFIFSIGSDIPVKTRD